MRGIHLLMIAFIWWVASIGWATLHELFLGKVCALLGLAYALTGTAMHVLEWYYEEKASKGKTE